MAVDQAEIARLFEGGPTETVEILDRPYPEKILEAICAFANTRGGRIVVRLGDIGTQMIDLRRAAAERVTRIIQSCPEVFPRCAPTVDFEVRLDLHVGVIQVDRSNERITFRDGHWLLRQGTQNIPYGMVSRQHPVDELDANASASEDVDSTAPESPSGLSVSLGVTDTDSAKTGRAAADDWGMQNSGSDETSNIAADVRESVRMSDQVSISVEPGGSVSLGAIASDGASERGTGNDKSTTGPLGDAALTPNDADAARNESVESASEKPNAGEPQVPQRFRIGSIHRFHREALPDEIRLKTAEYADVISRIFASADPSEKFSFALLGHWGRGKTFLMNQVADCLRAAGIVTVSFSAWKYRTTPEVWVHLYETLVDTAKNGNWLLPIRVSFARIGPWPAILAIIVLWGTLQTVGQQLSSLMTVIKYVGFAGFIYSVFVYFRVKSVALRLRHLYWSLPRHHEKLGLQAAIGRDLKSLLIGWLPGRMLQWDRGSRPAWLTQVREIVIAILAYLVCNLLVVLQLRDMVLLKTLERFLPATWKSSELGFRVAWIFPIIWVIVALGIPVAAYWPSLVGWWRSTPMPRALLIVDDLDRCHDRQMLEIMESILLLLDDPEIVHRLMISMLVDEVALEHALIDKYGSLTTDHNLGQDHNYDASRIVRENIEKLFLLHLRLAPIDDDELRELVAGVIGYDEKLGADFGDNLAALDEKTAEQLAGRADLETSGYGGGAPGPGTLKSQVRVVPTNPETTTVDPDAELTEDEKHALMQIVSELRESWYSGEWSPRAVRSLKFRYLIARMLLTRLRHRIDPTVLAKAFVIPMHPESEFDDRLRVPPEVVAIVSQVS